VTVPVVISLAPRSARASTPCASYGIVIYMYWRDHGPPHFHAEYGNHEALVVIDDGPIFASSLPRALRLVREWHRLHAQELEAARERASRCEDPRTIEPLP
jgi:hypothetical protein